MRFIITTFSFLVMLLSCNSSDKKISQAEIITEVKIDSVNKIEKPNLNINKAFVLGKFDYKTDSTFVKVSIDHSTKELYLNKQVYNAFLDMHSAANTDGIELKILSGTRNFKSQKAIWERKWEKYKSIEPTERALKILEYSSMPSTSRHHWGTDIDINNLNNSYFNSGKGLKEYQWLKANANSFGFYQVYTNKDDNRTGYNLEKWHWSYLPLASNYLEFYNNNITIDNINGFNGFEQAQKLNVINVYVNGIAQKAKDYK